MLLLVIIINRLIDSLYHCWVFFYWSKIGVKTVDYVWLWWFSPSMRQIGEPSGQQFWQQQTSVNNELDGEKKDNHITTTFLTDSQRLWDILSNVLTHFSWKWRWKEPPTRPCAHLFLNNIFSRPSTFYRLTSLSARFTFKAAIISHLRWHLQSDEGEVKSLRWLIIISKVPCHAADLNKRVEAAFACICMPGLRG